MNANISEQPVVTVFRVHFHPTDRDGKFIGNVATYLGGYKPLRLRKL
jgi:hypothetical protein